MTTPDVLSINYWLVTVDFIFITLIVLGLGLRYKGWKTRKRLKQHIDRGTG